MICSILLTFNQAHCKPPLSTEEVERIAASVARYAPHPEDNIAATLTDTGNADRFARDWADVIRFVPEWKKWLIWDGMRWGPDDSGSVMELAKESTRRIYEEGVGLVDGDVRTALRL